MKHIKLYEDINKIPQIGDYVICHEGDADQELQDFLETNIGQIIPTPDKEMGWDMTNPEFIWVKFKNSSISLSFRENSIFENKIRPFFQNEIIYNSPNIEDMKLILNVNKYNL